MVESFVTISEPEEQKPGAEVPSVSIQTEVEEETYGKFFVGPLERGYGITLGNPLRRMLLSSIPGAAVTWVRFEDVYHEYSSIPHVKEEVLELLQHIKAIRLRPLSDRPGRIRVDVKGPGEVYAGDLTVSADFEIMNPELHLATLDSSEGRLVGEFNVEHGRGYAPAVQQGDLPIGTLPVDAIFSPVRRVNYAVDRTRVGQVTDYERLMVEIWTDGTITPMSAMKSASQTLVDHFFLFTAPGPVAQESGAGPAIAQSVPAEVYNILVEHLELSSRTLNCLKRANIHKLGEILQRTHVELLKIRNFGEKSLRELIDRLEARGLPVPESPDINVPSENLNTEQVDEEE
jgi:DNA-directed RNA polymerase subunit alpha